MYFSISIYVKMNWNQQLQILNRLWKQSIQNITDSHLLRYLVHVWVLSYCLLLSAYSMLKLTSIWLSCSMRLLSLPPWSSFIGTQVRFYVGALKWHPTHAVYKLYTVVRPGHASNFRDCQTAVWFDLAGAWYFRPLEELLRSVGSAAAGISQ